jgi:hypothetical protein
LFGESSFIPYGCFDPKGYFASLSTFGFQQQLLEAAQPGVCRENVRRAGNQAQY